MSAKNPTRSMTSYRTYCEKRAKKIDDFLHANPNPNAKDLQELEKLNSDLEDQLKRMQVAWESMMADVEEDVFKVLDEMLDKVSEDVAKTFAHSKKVVSEKSATPNVVQSTTTTATSSGPPKIVDTLKPKSPLNEEMTLEEAQLWFKNYRAHLAYNKDALVQQEIQVQRAMLDVDLDPKDGISFKKSCKNHGRDFD